MKPNTVHPVLVEEESEDTKGETEAEVGKIESVPVQVIESAEAGAATESKSASETAGATPAEPDLDSVPDLSDEEGAENTHVNANGHVDDNGATATRVPRTRRISPEGKEMSKEKDELVPEVTDDVNTYIDKVVGPVGVPMMNLPGQIDEVVDVDKLLLNSSTNTKLRKSEFTSSTGRHHKAPPTIDALRNVGHLLIKQINKDKEDFANVPNNYDIVAKGVGRIFIGKEETHPEVRAKVQTSTSISQPFRMSIFDVHTGQEIIRIDRKGVNEAPTMVVQKKARTIDEQIGVIHFEHGWLMTTPTYTVQDHTGKTVLKIIGPPASRLCHSVKYVTSTFDIFDPTTTAALGGDGGMRRVAKITKDGDFYVNIKDQAEPITKEENLYIDFEDEAMDVKIKALILGTTFMLDYTYYNEPSFWTKFASFCCVGFPCCRNHK